MKCAGSLRQARPGPVQSRLQVSRKPASGEVRGPSKQPSWQVGAQGSQCQEPTPQQAGASLRCSESTMGVRWALGGLGLRAHRHRWLGDAQQGQNADGWPHARGPGSRAEGKQEVKQKRSASRSFFARSVTPAPSTDKLNTVLTAKEKCLKHLSHYGRAGNEG